MKFGRLDPNPRRAEEEGNIFTPREAQKPRKHSGEKLSG
jgi:hypothetical protein